jgi:hypothetical protein
VEPVRLLREAYQFEYRDSAGTDQLAQADLWESGGGERAVLVLRGLDARGGRERAGLLEQARQALGYLAHSWLPFMVPHAQLSVLVLCSGQSLSAELPWAESVSGAFPDHSRLLILTSPARSSTGVSAFPA